MTDKTAAYEAGVGDAMEKVAAKIILPDEFNPSAPATRSNAYIRSILSDSQYEAYLRAAKNRQAAAGNPRIGPEGPGQWSRPQPKPSIRKPVRSARPTNANVAKRVSKPMGSKAKAGIIAAGILSASLYGAKLHSDWKRR